ncbi:hypothetical protein GQR58_030623 [Nymphon striatum]|nr:hypothetical protein GQR58_030623 [Nymphon striatum]
MTNKTDKKREDLRKRLIDAAESAIRDGGLRGLKARDVTTKAGCALGGLYNAVQDLDQLVMLALAATYVDFALDNTALWSAVFNHRLPAGSEVPDWHKADYPVLIAEIIAPLSLLRPDLPPDALQLRAQTLFASVHGVVQLAIHGRFVGAPLSMLKSEVAALVDAMTRGIHLVEA